MAGVDVATTEGIHGRRCVPAADDFGITLLHTDMTKDVTAWMCITPRSPVWLERRGSDSWAFDDDKKCIATQ